MNPLDPEERTRLNRLRCRVLLAASNHDQFSRVFQNLLEDIDRRLAILEQMEALPPQREAA